MGCYAVVGADYNGQWVETPKCWSWRSNTSSTVPIALKLESTFDELIDSVIECGQLTYNHDGVSISYMLSAVPARGKITPSFIRNDNDLRIYLLDVDGNGSRPILYILLIERSAAASNIVAASPIAADDQMVESSNIIGDGTSKSLLYKNDEKATSHLPGGFVGDKRTCTCKTFIKRGRKRVQHIPSIGVPFTSKKRRNKCSNCKRPGHKKTTCPLAQNRQ